MCCEIPIPQKIIEPFELANRRATSRTVLASINKPFNLLISSANSQISVDDARAAGARRISVGGALARAGATGLFNAAQEIAQHGTFNYGADLIGSADMKLFLRPS